MDTEQPHQTEEPAEEYTPRMEDIHPRMTAEEKIQVLQEILRVLRGEE
jgi:hypothetical protein